MNGLLVRDWRYLRSQYVLFLILIGLTVLYMASDLMQFGECFAPLLLCVVIIRTIADDMRPSRARALFTLPFQRTQYVWGKILIGALLPLVLTVILTIIAMFTGRQTLNESVILCAVMAWVIGILTALFVPLSIRFRERAIIYLPLVIVAVGLVAMGYTAVAGEGSITHLITDMTTWLTGVPVWGVLAASVGISAALVGGSGLFSARMLSGMDL